MRIKYLSLILPCLLAAEFQTDLTYLVWQAKLDGLEFAARNTPKSATDISAKLAAVDYSWAPGFKLLLGYHFDKPSWDLNLRWTWFYSRSNRTLNEDLSASGAGLFPLWIPLQAAISEFPVYSHAKGTYLFLMNCVDMELSYKGCISDLFSLIVHGGLKFMAIDQTFRAKYSGGFFDGTNQMQESSAHAKLKGTGAGPRIGFGSEWMLPQNFSIVAAMTGAFILNDSQSKRKDQAIGTISGAPQEIATLVDEHAWVVCPLFEGRTGVNWHHCFGSQKTTQIDLLLAYEFHEFWAMNMFPRYADNAIFYMPFNSKGNLILQGVSFTLSVGY